MGDKIGAGSEQAASLLSSSRSLTNLRILTTSSVCPVCAMFGRQEPESQSSTSHLGRVSLDPFRLYGIWGTSCPLVHVDFCGLLWPECRGSWTLPLLFSTNTQCGVGEGRISCAGGSTETVSGGLGTEGVKGLRTWEEE